MEVWRFEDYAAALLGESGQLDSVQRFTSMEAAPKPCGLRLGLGGHALDVQATHSTDEQHPGHGTPGDRPAYKQPDIPLPGRSVPAVEAWLKDMITSSACPEIEWTRTYSERGSTYGQHGVQVHTNQGDIWLRIMEGSA